MICLVCSICFGVFAGRRIFQNDFIGDRNIKIIFSKSREVIFTHCLKSSSMAIELLVITLRSSNFDKSAEFSFQDHLCCAIFGPIWDPFVRQPIPLVSAIREDMSLTHCLM